tara:strand:+ start:1551 stop:1853 length:303 start_codon:yes stop_codon:yes gene_type:complete
MLFNFKKNYFTIIFTFLFLYFFFNLFDGERGLISYFEKKKILNNLNIEKASLEEKIKDSDHKNSLLTDNLDLDYIEILIRDKFIYGKKQDKIYIINNDEK